MDSKETVVDRLYKRNAKRIELLEDQRKLKDEINVSNEQLDYFSNIFREKSDAIESAFGGMETLERDELTERFEFIKRELHDLQNFVAASSFFLKEFNIRKSQAVIQNLQTRLGELETVFVPKKKFGFRNKGAVKKHVDSSKAKPVDEIDRSIDIFKNAKWDVVTCGFSNKSNERLFLNAEATLGKDISLSHLDNCVVIIKGNPGTLHIDNVSNSIILSGPVSTSIFLDKCMKCKLVMACQQLRCHSSVNCAIYLHVTSKAIIEDCHEIRVAPYNLDYEGIDADFASSSLDLNKNNWDSLDDFNWLATDVASPNWTVIDPRLRMLSWDPYFDNC